jgi:tetratricopeptide (TPR) repeat protein
MATSRRQRDIWVYVGIGAMISALLLFSLVPIVTSIWPPVATPTTATVPLPRENEALGYQLVLEREPDNQNALQSLLEIRLQQQDLAAAIAPLERLGQLNPDQVQYRILLAEAKTQLKDELGAARVYQEILSQDPYNIPALNGLSGLYQQQDRPAEAIAVVQNALSQAMQAQTALSTPSNPSQVTSLQLLLGEIYFAQNRPDQAIAIYDAASQANENDFRPWLAKAQVLAQTGNRKDAASLFQQATQLAPTQYKDVIKQMARQADHTATLEPEGGDPHR